MSPPIVAGVRVGVLLPSTAMLSLVSSTDTLCLSWRTATSSSFPVCLANCLPSKDNTLLVAPLTLCHLCLEGVLHAPQPLLDHLLNQGALQWVHHCNVQGRVLALGPVHNR